MQPEKGAEEDPEITKQMPTLCPRGAARPLRKGTTSDFNVSVMSPRPRPREGPDLVRPALLCKPTKSQVRWGTGTAQGTGQGRSQGGGRVPTGGVPWRRRTGAVGGAGASP